MGKKFYKRKMFYESYFSLFLIYYMQENWGGYLFYNVFMYLEEYFYKWIFKFLKIVFLYIIFFLKMFCVEECGKLFQFKVNM